MKSLWFTPCVMLAMLVVAVVVEDIITDRTIARSTPFAVTLAMGMEVSDGK
jgi:hypothetical protein